MTVNKMFLYIGVDLPSQKVSSSSDIMEVGSTNLEVAMSPSSC